MSSCFRCAELTQQVAELTQRADRMARYLSTHDHTLHNAAMNAMREHPAATAPTPE